MELFNFKEALEINEARIKHLDSLLLDFNNKKILETGCGGRGDIKINKFKLFYNLILKLIYELSNSVSENGIVFKY